ncbi:MAG: sugar phosphate isomerase/epimerase [Oscillospiraceae bacterium]|nr:sugar phosphate isomerase/epimerase [Oscillospiraceae bacterium]
MDHRIRFGSQSYTWFMSYDKYFGKVPHMLDIVARSKFEGIEFTTNILGEYIDPAKLKEALHASGTPLAAIAISLPWLSDAETDDEFEEIKRVIELVSAFPETLLMLGQKPVGDRDNLYAKQKKQINIVNGIAKRASEKDITVAYHTNSQVNSLFRTQEEYYILAELLDERFIGLALDAGHMAYGGCDVPGMFIDLASKIKHVHYKDMKSNLTWTPMGEGIIDFRAITKSLRDSGYYGWIMVEDESPEAEINPDDVTFRNGEYVNKYLG